MDMGLSTTCKWAMREMIVAKRLPIFGWQVWALLAVFAIGVAVGVAIGIDQNEIIKAAKGA